MTTQQMAALIVDKAKQNGLNDNLIKQIDDVLEARELIKLSVLETAPDDNFFIANELADKLKELEKQIVEVIK